jgi:hypothetical protein
MAPPATKEKLQMDGPFRIMVRERFHQFANLGLDAQFLGQLTMEALLEGLARLAFPARKFPQASQVSIRHPLGDEQFALAEDHARRHLDDQAFPRPMLL